MANGNFTRSATVTANASMAFVGNIDDSVEAIVNSTKHTLFKPLHPVFDLAILDRFHTFVPGWEIPKNRDENLTRNYGLIIEYLAEAFHHLARKTNRFAHVKTACRLGPGFDQRDQTAVLKTVCAFVKMLHPGADPTQDEINEYLAYAIEGRRRVKEQLNKKKPDDEFASINLGYYDTAGHLTTVFCPESRNADATQNPARARTVEGDDPAEAGGVAVVEKPAPTEQAVVSVPDASEVAPRIPVSPLGSDAGEQGQADQPSPAPAKTPAPRHYRIHYGATGHSYEAIFGDYLPGAEEIHVEDPYIRQQHQIINFLRFCETAVRVGSVRSIHLTTRFDNEAEKSDALLKLGSIAESLKQFNVSMNVRISDTLHDREIRLSNGWVIKIGRGFDIYQRPDDWFSIGVNDLSFRPCMETSVDVLRSR
jgi:ATP-dependent Lon protease